MTVDTGNVLSFAESKELVSDPTACLKLVTADKHVALLPKFIGKFGSGIKQVLNAELKFYSEQLDGVILSYNNVKIRSNHGSIMNHHPHIHIDIQADFIVFQPKVGTVLKGVVNKLGTDHIGLLVHNCFNGSVPLDGIPSENVKIGMTLTFMVKKIYTSNRLICFNGKLTDESKTKLGGEVKETRKRTLSTSEEGAESPPKKKKKSSTTEEVIESPSKKKKKSSTSEEVTDSPPKKKKKSLSTSEEVIESPSKKKKKKKSKKEDKDNE